MPKLEDLRRWMAGENVPGLPPRSIAWDGARSETREVPLLDKPSTSETRAEAEDKLERVLDEERRREAEDLDRVSPRTGMPESRVEYDDEEIKGVEADYVIIDDPIKPGVEVPMLKGDALKKRLAEAMKSTAETKRGGIDPAKVARAIADRTSKKRVRDSRVTSKQFKVSTDGRDGTLLFGRHNGRSLSEVAEVEPDYLRWLVKSNEERPYPREMMVLVERFIAKRRTK